MVKLLLAVVVGIAVVASAGAMFVEADVKNVPVDRLLANLEQQRRDQPRNVELIVNAARIHAMAYAARSQNVPTAQFSPDKVWLGHGVPEYKQFEVHRTDNAAREAAARDHLTLAIARYREALAIAPDNLVAMLGLGWALIESGDRTAAIDTLRAVLAKAWPADQAGTKAMHGQPSLTEEAAKYLIPLLDEQRDRDEIRTLRDRVKTMEKQPRWITPVAVPLGDGLSALDIVDDDARVLFDADGSGIPKRWTWIRPNAAWLVFDRMGAGQITSALQLFGSVTFWLFWDNGYHALRALDDDADGALRGAELAGLALWHDRNANGRSEPGEVRPVGEWHIASISCRFEHDSTHPDEIPFSARGVTFADGTTRPTFDVVLRAAGISAGTAARVPIGAPAR